MKLNDFPADIQPHLLPSHTGRMVYRCLGCGGQFGIEQLLYVCPECRQVLLIEDLNGPRLKQIPGPLWRRIFDYRKMLTLTALKGIYRYHEFIGPVIPLEAVVYLGDGQSGELLPDDPVARDAKVVRAIQEGRREGKEGVVIKADKALHHREVSRVASAVGQVEGTKLYLAVFDGKQAP